MISKKIYLILVLLLPAFLLFAQDFDNYKPSISQSPLPDAFLTSSTQKYEEAIKKDQATNGSLGKDRHKFHLETNFILDELLISGKLIFNDAMSKYVNKVLDNILKEQPELRARIQIYIIRSPSVNAFATDRAEIFVNTGLIAKLKNEAELAFILCHEIQHILGKHSLKTYVEFGDLDNIQRGDNYDEIVKKHSYEKDLEREADKKGLELFLKSNYSVIAAEGVFDLLSLTHVPYANDSFKISYFENDYIKFTDYTPIREINEIKPIEDDEDKFSTHPSLIERRKTFIENTTKQNKKGSLYLQSKAEFDRIQKIARFDLCDILLANRSYPASLYHSLLILNKYPNNVYAEKNVAKSLYGLSQFINKLSYNKESVDIDDDKIYDVQGQMQLVFHFLDRLTPKELNVLTGRYCWNLAKKYPNDVGLSLMAQDMIEDIVMFQVEKPFIFFESKAMPNEKTSFAPFGFGDLLSDKLFIEWLKNGESYRKDMETRYGAEGKLSYKNYYSKSRKEKKELRKATKKERKALRAKKRKGVHLGIDTAIFINPIYLQIKVDDNELQLELIKAEEKQLKIKTWIEQFGEDLGLKAIVLDGKHVNDATKIAEYNEIVQLTRWMNELLSNDMFMISSNYNEVQKIMEKYNTSTIAYTGALSIQFEKKSKFITLYTNIIFAFTPFMPFVTSISLTPLRESIYYSVVFDFKNNTVIYSDYNHMTMQGANEGTIKSNLYWLMLQMNRTKKNKK